jgi:hypothetical protein
VQEKSKTLPPAETGKLTEEIDQGESPEFEEGVPDGRTTIEQDPANEEFDGGVPESAIEEDPPVQAGDVEFENENPVEEQPAEELEDEPAQTEDVVEEPEEFQEPDEDADVDAGDVPPGDENEVEDFDE